MGDGSPNRSPVSFSCEVDMRGTWMRISTRSRSHSGFMTVWLAGHDQRFACTVSQRGVYDLAHLHAGWRLKNDEHSLDTRPASVPYP